MIHLKDIPISQIVPNPEQPRKEFDQEALQGLANSIIENGLIQPITVEATNDSQVFVLEDGERRWRACALAGLTMIKAIVKPVRETEGAQKDRLTNALVANLQREDMNPIEEAQAYQRLIIMGGYSSLKIGQKLGVSVARIRHRLKLLELDEPIQDLIAQGKLQKDLRVIDALLSIPNEEARIKLANRMASPGVTVSLILAASKKLLEKLADSKGVPEGETPSTHYAQRTTGPVTIPIWDRLAEEGKLPHWEMVKDSSKKACKQCAFFDQPSAAICGECPAVLLVGEMIKLTFSQVDHD